MRAATSLTNTTVIYGAAHATADEAAARRAIELARELGESSALARVLSSLGFMVMNSGRERFAEGLGYVQEGFGIARASGEAHAAATLKRALALGYLLDGRFSESQRSVEESLAELEQLGDRARLSDTFLGARFFLFRALFESDQLDAAEDAARETLALAVEANNRTVHSASAAGIATTLFLRAQYAEALDWASRAYDIAARIENIGAIRSALAVRMLARAELGDRAGRQAELEAMQRGLLSQGDFAMNVDLIVAALAAVGELEGARRIADLAARRAGGRLRDARNTVSRAEVALAGGQVDACTPGCFLDDVISLATEIGARSVAARGRLAVARYGALRGRVELVEENGRDALTTFEELGFEHYARKTREVLGEPLQIEPAA
jgi:tetratricopeptide (TPR) repeat protein